MRGAITLFYAALLLTNFFIQNIFAGKAPIKMNDLNFDQLTKSIKGSNTANWFVMFYAPWCGHCKSLEPTWDSLAVELTGRVNVGKVDATQNEKLSQRFEIRGYPTILYFSEGYYMQYKGARRLEPLVEFAINGYKDEGSKPIPKGEESRVSKMGLATVQEAIEFAKQAPVVVGALLFLTLSIGIFVGRLGFSAMRSSATPPSTSSGKKGD